MIFPLITSLVELIARTKLRKQRIGFVTRRNDEIIIVDERMLSPARLVKGAGVLPQ
jgi:hypothetical protein